MTKIVGAWYQPRQYGRVWSVLSTSFAGQRGAGDPHFRLAVGLLSLANRRLLIDRDGPAGVRGLPVLLAGQTGNRQFLDK